MATQPFLAALLRTGVTHGDLETGDTGHRALPPKQRCSFRGLCRRCCTTRVAKWFRKEGGIGQALAASGSSTLLLTAL